jgi:hypothetical protein
MGGPPPATKPKEISAASNKGGFLIRQKAGNTDKCAQSLQSETGRDTKRTGRVSSGRSALNPSKPRGLQRGDARHREYDAYRYGYHVRTMPEGSLHRHISGIRFSRLAETYQLNCPPPCATARQFQEHLMLPYRVADEVFRTGYAVEGEYEPVPIERRTLHYLTAHG